jgi:hypothetical protein
MEQGDSAGLATFSRHAWLVLLAPILALVASLTLGYLWNEDFWWYLTSGQEILERGGRLPAEDPFLYTADEGGAGWVYHSWLWTVLVALAHQLGGLTGVQVFHAATAAALVALLYTTARVDRFGLVNALAVLLFVVTMRHRLDGKAEVATWMMVVLFFWLLDRRERFTWKIGAALAGLQALWASLHGGYPLGIFLAACYGVGGWVEGRLRRGTPRAAEGDGGGSRHPPLWFPALLGAAALADPRLLAERLEALKLPFGLDETQPTAGSGTMLILEWRSPFSPLVEGASFAWLYVAAAALGLLSFALVRPRSLPRFLFFAGMAVLGATALRHLSGLALAAALVTLANLADRTVPAPGKRARKRKARRPALRRWAYPAACALLGAFLTAGAVALWRARAGFDVGGSQDFFAHRPAIWSPGAAEFLREHELPGPIFHDYQLGAYLAFYLHPERRMFIDARALDPALIERYTEMVSSEAAWRRAEARYGFRTAVLGHFSQTVRSPLGAALHRDPRWRLVYVSPLAVVFVKDDRATPPGIRLRAGADASSPRVPYVTPPGALGALGRWWQRALLHDSPMNHLVEYLANLGHLGLARDVEELATEALAARPDHPLLLRQRCAARAVRGDLTAAREDCRRAHASRPDDPQVVALYCAVLDRTGDHETARSLLRQALRDHPDDPGLRQLLDRLSP